MVIKTNRLETIAIFPWLASRVFTDLESFGLAFSKTI